METHINIIGIILILLALIHLVFPKYFNWKKELSSLTLINRQMMIVHTFFIALTVFLMGLLCVTCADDLVNTSFGRNISFGFGIFWSVRLIFQLFIYSSALWKNRIFETIVHIVFTLLWTYLSIVFLIVYFVK